MAAYRQLFAFLSFVFIASGKRKAYWPPRASKAWRGRIPCEDPVHPKLALQSNLGTIASLPMVRFVFVISLEILLP
jgi:hypothetical protein